MQTKGAIIKGADACVSVAEHAARGPDRMPAGARKQLAQSQNTAKADPEGDDTKSDGILGSLRVCIILRLCQTIHNVCRSFLFLSEPTGTYCTGISGGRVHIMSRYPPE